ncbi:cation:proton antiporter [Flavicella sediminum]|uniref:cation:proton antiporter n=1 Tax=Flavicella sediminum TaxID=2585141 RepID=UPI0011243E62|nr:cation:proton antiporter [Flavicella sediminum]
MVFLAAVNHNLSSFVLLGIVVILIGMILRHFKQPYIIAYILAGVLIGKHGFKMLTDEDIIHVIGEFGLILLLFFIGMEISLLNLVKNWKIPTFGTLIQIGASLVVVAIIGSFFGWNVNRIVVLGFIMSLSSSAVIIKLLQDNNESQTTVGKNVIGILLMQDILIVPLLIITNYLGGNAPSKQEIALQITGGILITLGILWILKKKEFSLPYSEELKNDHELQVIFAFIVCFGFAVATAFFGLSAALGAFVGGMVVNASKSTEWFHHSLHSFRILFVAIFFVSIGMLIDLKFLMEHIKIVGLLLFAVYFCNHLINTLVIYYFGKNWKDSLYGGALLAQIGELSFLLASSAFYSGIVSDFEYQLTIIVISLTLLISPFWIATTKKLLLLMKN